MEDEEILNKLDEKIRQLEEKKNEQEQRREEDSKLETESEKVAELNAETVETAEKSEVDIELEKLKNTRQQVSEKINEKRQKSQSMASLEESLKVIKDEYDSKKKEYEDLFQEAMALQGQDGMKNKEEEIAINLKLEKIKEDLQPIEITVNQIKLTIKQQKGQITQLNKEIASLIADVTVTKAEELNQDVEFFSMDADAPQINYADAEKQDIDFTGVINQYNESVQKEKMVQDEIKKHLNIYDPMRFEDFYQKYPELFKEIPENLARKKYFEMLNEKIEETLESKNIQHVVPKENAFENNNGPIVRTANPSSNKESMQQFASDRVDNTQQVNSARSYNGQPMNTRLVSNMKMPNQRVVNTQNAVNNAQDMMKVSVSNGYMYINGETKNYSFDRERLKKNILDELSNSTVLGRRLFSDSEMNKYIGIMKDIDNGAIDGNIILAIIEKYKTQTYNQLANGYEMTSTMNNAKQSIMNALDSYCNRRDNSLFDVTYDLKEKANMSQSDYMELKDLAHNLRGYAKVNASWSTKLAWKIEDLKNKLFNKNKPLQITDGNNKNNRAESFDSAKKDNMPNVLAQTPTKINRNNEPARNDFAPKAEPVTTEEINAILNRMNRQNQQGINHDIGSK